MNHIHKKSNQDYEVGVMKDFDGSTYDMCIITKWDPNCNESPTLVDYYFGEYDPEFTDYCIDKFIEKQNQLRKSIKRMSDDLMIDREVMEPDDVKDFENTIKSVSEMISNLV
jgi:hypothetical protein